MLLRKNKDRNGTEKKKNELCKKARDGESRGSGERSVFLQKNRRRMKGGNNHVSQMGKGHICGWQSLLCFFYLINKGSSFGIGKKFLCLLLCDRVHLWNYINRKWSGVVVSKRNTTKERKNMNEKANHVEIEDKDKMGTTRKRICCLKQYDKA